MTSRTETVMTTDARGKGVVAQSISKLFSGVPALSDVTVSVRPGEVLGLVGHNGAGKSTLLKVLSGAFTPDGGQVIVDGVPQDFRGPADAIRASISTVYQELSLLANLTITQNVFLGRERARSGMLERARMRVEAQELVDRFGIDVDVDQPLGNYPVATRQLLEIAVASHRNAKYLLLDEPTTSLEGEQVDHFLRQVTDLAKVHNLGVVLVDHKLDELFAVADRVVALVDGQVVIDGSAADVSRADVVRAIAGEEAAHSILKDFDIIADGAEQTQPEDVEQLGAPQGEPSLSVTGLSNKALRDVNLQAFPGRVLGIYGLVGSGRTEFLRAVAGIDPIESGSLKLDGADFLPKRPSRAQQAGVVYLTEERKFDGIIPMLDSETNVVLPILATLRRGPFLNKRAMEQRATEAMDGLKVLGDRAGAVSSLSGGNQQKVLLARALVQNPKVLLLDEPTKGVDLGVKADIHRIIRSLAHDGGMTVILVSSEEDEVLEASDDVVVFSSGRCDGVATPAGSLTAAQLRQTAWSAA